VLVVRRGGDVAWLRSVLGDIPCAVAQRVYELPAGWPREPAPGGAGAAAGLRPVRGGVPAVVAGVGRVASRPVGTQGDRVAPLACRFDGRRQRGLIIWAQGGVVPALSRHLPATSAS
jgi:hypothetical protein